MGPRDKPSVQQDSNDPAEAPYTSEEKQYVKDNFGTEYHALQQHGLSIYDEDDREEGRSIVRSFRDMDLKDEQRSSENERGDGEDRDAIDGHDSERKDYNGDHDEGTRYDHEDHEATQHECGYDEGADFYDEYDERDMDSSLGYENGEYDEDDSGDNEEDYHDDDGGGDGDGYDDANYDDGGYEDGYEDDDE